MIYRIFLLSLVLATSVAQARGPGPNMDALRGAAIGFAVGRLTAGSDSNSFAGDCAYGAQHHGLDAQQSFSIYSQDKSNGDKLNFVIEVCGKEDSCATVNNYVEVPAGDVGKLANTVTNDRLGCFLFENRNVSPDRVRIRLQKNRGVIFATEVGFADVPLSKLKIGANEQVAFEIGGRKFSMKPNSNADIQVIPNTGSIPCVRLKVIRIGSPITAWLPAMEP